MPPDYGLSNLPPEQMTASAGNISIPWWSGCFYQQADPNYSVAFGLVSIAQAINRLADVLEKSKESEPKG
jgi:hypothetical protein